jgi:hypothetical protein
LPNESPCALGHRSNQESGAVGLERFSGLEEQAFARAGSFIFAMHSPR